MLGQGVGKADESCRLCGMPITEPTKRGMSDPNISGGAAIEMGSKVW